MNADNLADSDPRAIEMLRQMRESWDNAPVNNAMDDQQVRIAGYLVPLDGTKAGLTRFLLVPYFGACIHTPPPPSNQIIDVSSATPARFKMMATVWVSGTLRTLHSDTEMGSTSYRMQAKEVELYRPGLDNGLVVQPDVDHAPWRLQREFGFEPVPYDRARHRPPDGSPPFDMNSSKANLRRQLAHVVLALLLLCGQQFATRHWLAHAIESTYAKHPGLPEGGHCLVCDGLVTFGAALPTHVFALPEMPPQGLANSPDLNLSVVITGIATGYHSRAPPAVA